MKNPDILTRIDGRSGTWCLPSKKEQTNSKKEEDHMTKYIGVYALVHSILSGSGPEVSLAIISGNALYPSPVEDFCETVMILRELGWSWEDCAKYVGYKNGQALQSRCCHIKKENEAG